jgi:hypothetical protein
LELSFRDTEVIEFKCEDLFGLLGFRGIGTRLDEVFCCVARIRKHYREIASGKGIQMNAGEKNTRLVLEAFDMLLNKRDYAATDKFWSPHYIQHSSHTSALSDNVSGTTNSQLSDDLHEVVHFLIQGCLADSQVLLHANAGKEGQDHRCEYRWFHLGFLGFDISLDQIFEKSVALRNDFLRLAWEHRELVHGIDREAASLTLQAAGRQFQKALDVLPAEWAGRQQLFLLPFSQVVSQTLQIQISLVRKLGIEAGLVYARRLFQVLKAGIRKAVFPEDRQRLLQNAFPAEVLRPPHACIMTY